MKRVFALILALCMTCALFATLFFLLSIPLYSSSHLICKIKPLFCNYTWFQ